MKESNERRVTLTPLEVSDILSLHFKFKEDAKVSFKVSGVEDPGDHLAQSPLSYELVSVTIRGEP